MFSAHLSYQLHPFELFQKPHRGGIHFGKGKPLLAQILEGRTDVIEIGFVDYEKTIVGIGKDFERQGLVLGVEFLNIKA